MEQFANFPARAVLDGDVTNSATVWDVLDDSFLPTDYPYRIRADDELVKVTGSPGSNQITVVRGDGSTTGAIHLDGITIRVVMTKESVDAILSVWEDGVEKVNTRFLNFIGATVVDNAGFADITISLPTNEEREKVDPTGLSVTWADQDDATITVNTDQKSIYVGGMAAQNVGVTWHTAAVAVPGSTFTWIIKFANCMFDSGSAWPGIGVMNSSGDYTLVAIAFGAATAGFYIQHGNGTTQSTIEGPHKQGTANWNWFKATSDGTTLKFYLSVNGINWQPIRSETLSGYMGTPAYVFIALNPNTDQTNDLTGIIISSWELS